MEHKCALCNLYKIHGKVYKFMYGKSQGTVNLPTKHALEKGRYAKIYDIAGEKEAWICRQCFLKGGLSSKYGVAYVLILIGWGHIFFKAFQSEPSIENFIGAGLIGLLGLFVTFIWHYSDHKEDWLDIFGDNQAIKSFRPHLERDGWDVFFNRYEAKKLGYLKPNDFSGRR